MSRPLLRRLSQCVYFVWDCAHFVCGDGTWSLRPHESQVVAAVIDSIAADKREVVRQQLSQRFFVERLPQGRINVLRYYENDPGLAIGDPQFADCLFKVGLEIDGTTQTAHVTFHRGWLFSVEFKKPGRFFAGKRILIRQVAAGSPRASYTRAIDRAAHGTTSSRGEREE